MKGDLIMGFAGKLGIKVLKSVGSVVVATAAGCAFDKAFGAIVNKFAPKPEEQTEMIDVEATEVPVTEAETTEIAETDVEKVETEES